MLIQQATSVSADSIINSNIVLFISYVLYLTFNAKEMNIKNKIILSILSLLVVVSKNVYMPIIFLNLMLLTNKNINNRNNKKYIIILIVTGIIIGILTFLIGTTYKDVIIEIEGYDYNPKEQVLYILKNPIEFIKVVGRTIRDESEYLYYSAFGTPLGFLNINVENKLPIIFYTFLLLMACFLEKNEKELTQNQKMLFCTIGIIIIALIFLAFYLMSTLVADLSIKGIQGRYFIPIILLFLLPIIKKENYIKMKFPMLLCLISIFIINFSGIKAIIRFFI